MREVGREHEELGTGLLHHPIHRFSRERRELEMPAHVVGRRQLESLQRLFGAAEGPDPVVEVTHPRHHPARPLLDAAATQLGEAIEESVVDQRSEEDLRRVGDRQEVLRPDVLATPEVVGHRHRVVVKRRVEEPAATADVQHEGHVRFAEHVPERRPGPDGSVTRVPAAVEGTITAAQPASIASTARRNGTARVDERDEGHREQPLVLRAEVGHGPVLSRTPGVEAILVPADEPRRGEGGEDELALDAEQVEHPAPLRRVERAHGVPTLVLAGAAPRPVAPRRRPNGRASDLATASVSTAARRSLVTSRSRSLNAGSMKSSRKSASSITWLSASRTLRSPT